MVDLEQRRNQLDMHIGRRVYERRTELGIEQVILAKALSVSAQDLDECETGRSRIPATLLFQVCEVLGVPVTYFFEGLTDVRPVQDVRSAERSTSQGEVASALECLQVVQAFQKISNPAMRLAIIQLIRVGSDPDAMPKLVK